MKSFVQLVAQCQVSARNFGSFAVDGLAVAIWSMYHTTSFDEAVGKARMRG